MSLTRKKSAMLSRLLEEMQPKFECMIGEKQRDFRTVEHLRRRMETIRDLIANSIRSSAGDEDRVPFLLTFAQGVGVVGTDDPGASVSDMTDRIFSVVSNAYGDNYYRSVERTHFVPLFGHYLSAWGSRFEMADPEYVVLKKAGTGTSFLQKVFLLSDVLSIHEPPSEFPNVVLRILQEYPVPAVDDVKSFLLFSERFAESFVTRPIEKLKGSLNDGYYRTLQKHAESIRKHLLSIRTDGSVERPLEEVLLRKEGVGTAIA